MADKRLRILIVKLGAMGDVLRTTPILTALKAQNPQARIDWLVDKSCREVLEGNPLIDRLFDRFDSLKNNAYDLAMNFDKEDEALDALMKVSAVRKAGFGRSADGKLCPMDERSVYAYRLGIDDDLKFRQNKKSYQEITFEQAGLTFRGEEYIFTPDPKTPPLPGLTGPIVGLNTGSGRRFAGKKMPLAAYAELSRRLVSDLKATVLLLGGRDEIERNRQIRRLCEVPVVETGSYPIKQFSALVKACDVVVSGDTVAMHMAIAVRVPVVAFFASTCAAEIELYGRGRKIISTISCAPCYLRDCPIDEQCMKDMSVETIVDAVRETLEKVSR